MIDFTLDIPSMLIFSFLSFFLFWSSNSIKKKEKSIVLIKKNSHKSAFFSLEFELINFFCNERNR